MQKKRSLDDATYFFLENELNERLLIYNLLLQANENNGETALTYQDLEWVKARTHNCVLMDYGGYLGELLKRVTSGKPRLPEGVRGFYF